MTEPKTARELWNALDNADTVEEAINLIEADRQAVREDCAERATTWHRCFYPTNPDAFTESLRAAIKGETK